MYNIQNNSQTKQKFPITAMPIVLAFYLLIPAFFNSQKVKPRPALTLKLYLTVGGCTAGLKKPKGRGAYLAALD